jgi:hypothetical protein
MGIFTMTPMLPKCCMAKKFMKWYMYKWVGHFHDDGDNQCIHCGNPAYKRYSRSHKENGKSRGGYDGWIGFCTYCDCSWVES